MACAHGASVLGAVVRGRVEKFVFFAVLGAARVIFAG